MEGRFVESGFVDGVDFYQISIGAGEREAVRGLGSAFRAEPYRVREARISGQPYRVRERRAEWRFVEARQIENV